MTTTTDIDREAVRAAQAVYDADRDQYVQKQLDEARLAGMDITDEGMLNVEAVDQIIRHATGGDHDA